MDKQSMVYMMKYYLAVKRIKLLHIIHDSMDEPRKMFFCVK